MVLRKLISTELSDSFNFSFDNFCFLTVSYPFNIFERRCICGSVFKMTRKTCFKKECLRLAAFYLYANLTFIIDDSFLIAAGFLYLKLIKFLD